jgi:hypothetical protein
VVGCEGKALPNRISALTQEPGGVPLSLPPCGHSVKKAPAMNQEAGLYQTLDLLAP